MTGGGNGGRLHWRGCPDFTLCETHFAQPPVRIADDWRSVTCLDCAVDLAAGCAAEVSPADALAHFPDALGLSAEEFLDEIRLNWENFDPEATVRRRLEGGGDAP